MFRVSSSGQISAAMSARDAAAVARKLQSGGANDVEIYRDDDTRVSLYGLEQLIRLEERRA